MPNLQIFLFQLIQHISGAQVAYSRLLLVSVWGTIAIIIRASLRSPGRKWDRNWIRGLMKDHLHNRDHSIELPTNAPCEVLAVSSALFQLCTTSADLDPRPANSGD